MTTLPGWPSRAKIRRADAADELEPLGRRVDEHQLVDRQHVPQPGEPVDQLGGVRRPAADDRELHPLPLSA